MNPEYFLHRLTWHEAADYLEGLTRRYWVDWERTRMEVNTIYRSAGGKHDVMKDFYWEKKEKEEELKKNLPTESEKDWFKDAAKFIESRANEKELVKKRE